MGCFVHPTHRPLIVVHKVGRGIGDPTSNVKIDTPDMCSGHGPIHCAGGEGGYIYSYVSI
jgi:hypothetical protein